MKTLYRLISLLAILAMVLSACTSKTEEPAKVEPTKAPVTEPTKAAVVEPTKAPVVEDTKAPEPTEPPAKADPMAYLDAPREDTVIIDNPYVLEGGDNWNPFAPGNATGWGWQMGNSPLMMLNYGDGKLVMWMAESFESNDDASVWTLKIKKGITWNDGVPFTVDDLIYTVELQKATEGLGQYFTYNEWIDKVEKVNDFEMTFTLKKPNVRFAVERWGIQIGGADTIIPKHIWETVADPMTFTNYDPAKGLPVGNGPYVLGKVTSNETIWVRNDDWWGAKMGYFKLPEPKRVIYSYVGTEEVRTQTGIENGFDTMQDMTLGAFEALKGQNDKWIAFYPGKPYAWLDPCARILAINSLVEPWNDKEMRWVLNYVLDRQQIIDIAYEGTTMMAPYLWPAYPSMQPYADLIPQETMDKFLKPNTAEAEKIMLAKGYTKGAKYWQKDGKDLAIEIQAPEYIELERIADVYVEQLQKFGINASKLRLESAFYDNWNAGNYTVQSNWFACGSIAEPWLTLRNFVGEPGPMDGTNFTAPAQNGYRWTNARYTELVNEIGGLKWDDPKLLEYTKEALAILYDELPALPSAQARKLVPFNETYWTGWPTADNYYMTPTNWWSNFILVIDTITKAK